MDYNYWKKTKKMKAFKSVDEFVDFEKDLINEYGSSDIPKPAAHSKPIAKKGISLGIQFDSFSEFVFYTYMTKIKFATVERNIREHFLYYIDENNKQRRYYPDFIVNGVYAEVKGRFTLKDSLKKEQHPEVKWYFSSDIENMQKILNNKFGTSWKANFVETSNSKNKLTN